MNQNSFVAVVVVLLVVLGALSAYTALEVSSLSGKVDSLQGKVDSLQTQNLALKNQLGNLSTAARGEITVSENISLDPLTFYDIGPVYVTFGSVMVRAGNGSWIPISTSNRTVALLGGQGSFLGRAAVHAGNYTEVKLTIVSALITITNETSLLSKNVTDTLPVTPLTLQAPISHGAIVFASTTSVSVIFSPYIFGGNALYPSLTLRIQTVSSVNHE